ncbi:MAG: Zn-dependent hydrolase [Clostridium sp.]
MKINLEKIISHINELYQCGVQEDGTHSRVVYSKEDIRGRETFMEYFMDLGLQPRIDEAGNLIIRMEGRDSTLPAIVMGSHLDTVPDGGKYDGVLGCVGGLCVCETFLENGYKPLHPIEVIVFTDEEGYRFGNGLLGSNAICGVDPMIHEDDLDMYGEPRSEVMKSYGIKVSEISKAERSEESIHCFLELHIEQGASLDKKGTSIGIVSSIAGVSRYEVVIHGEANHSGSTVMTDRKDALVAAAEFIAQVPMTVETYGKEYTVATVGTIKVSPNSVNVVPGKCVFNLEIRDQEDEMLDLIENKLTEQLKKICEKAVNSFEFRKISYHKPAPMSAWVKGEIEGAIKELGFDYEVVPSGAFHDSLVMTERFNTGMIFVPSVKGISHSRDEFTHEKDIEKGCQVLLNTVLAIDKNK